MMIVTNRVDVFRGLEKPKNADGIHDVGGVLIVKDGMGRGLNPDEVPSRTLVVWCLLVQLKASTDKAPSLKDRLGA